MAPKSKRPSPLDDPPAASSSEEDQEASSEEAASGSGSEESESEDEPSQQPKTTASTAKPQPKKPDHSAAAAKPQASSSGETETESDSESDGGDGAKKVVHVKPIASKPMEAATPPPKATKPRSKPQASPAPAKSGTKRPSGESEPVKDSKKAKQKGDEDHEEEDESKKSKLFQRIWSDEDEIIILKGMNEYATKRGVDPYADMAAFHEFIKKSLKVDVSKTQLQDKIRRMKKKFGNNLGKKQKSTKPHDAKTFELSKKVWGGGEDVSGKVEQPKTNGKAKVKSIQEGTMASLKADVMASPERPKAEKSEASLKPCASGSVLSEVIGFDKGFKELGLSETIVQQGLELIGASKCAELKEKWTQLHIDELQLFVRRTELMNGQAKMILEALKSDH